MHFQKKYRQIETRCDIACEYVFKIENDSMHQKVSIHQNSSEGKVVRAVCVFSFNMFTMESIMITFPIAELISEISLHIL